MTIFDISPTLNNLSPVWPGDTPFQLNKLLNIHDGSNIDLGNIHTTLHVGAHTDAPLHYQKEGKSMGEVDLIPYIGPAQVIQVDKKFGRILPKDLSDEIKAPRILFKTGSFDYEKSFSESFASLSAELVEFLAKHDVTLVGIDTPSVDPFDDKILETHQALFKYKMRNIEGLVLGQVSPGQYNFVGLPLKLQGADASPVRAILYK